jgi:hypothetical protein
MAAPRHRRETADELPVPRYDPQIPLRSIDFEAVSPMRHPDEPKTQPTPLATSDALFLAHS